MLVTIVLILLVLMLLGALPSWGYSAGWGYGPSSVVAFLLVLFIALALIGKV